MRKTVTLDKDVERLLKDAMRRSRRSFKTTLNDAVRAALQKPYVVKASPMGLRAGIDPASFNRLTDDLEADAFLEPSAGTKK